MKKNEFYACTNDVIKVFGAVLADMESSEFMNVSVRKAKSTKCAVRGCRKMGNYLILVQYFPQVSSKALQ